MRPWAVLIVCASLLSGCANTALVRYEKIAKKAGSQDYLNAAKMIRKDPEALYGSRSDLLYNMDLGLLYHYAGRYDSSTVFLGRAADRYDALYTRSLSNEAASLVVNDNTRPYRSRPYEMMWLRVIQAFNYLALGKPDDARVEMRQAQILLDELRRTADTGPNGYREDPLYRGTAALVYDLLGERDDAAIAAYYAVKAHRDGNTAVPPMLGSLACRLLKAADRSDDIRLLELDCPPPLPGKRAVDSAAAATGSSETGDVVVIGMLGRSPAIGETTFQGTWIRDGLLVYSYRDANGKQVTDALPAPGLPVSESNKAGSGKRTRSGTTLSLKWAMPSLREVPVQSQVMKVAGGAGPAVVAGETWGDTHDLLERDLADNWNTVLVRTVVRVGLRTLATEKAKAEMRTDNPLLNLLTNLGADFLSGQLEQADVRSWFLLPRTVQVARLTLPVGHQTLQVGAENASGGTVTSETHEVDVRAGQTSFVFFNSLK